MADGVLLLIEHLLLAFGDMAVVNFGHITLLLANRVVFLVKLVGLLLCDLAFFQFTVDAAVLVCEPVIDLIATRVIALHCVSAKAADTALPATANEITKMVVLDKARMDFPFLSDRRKIVDPCEILSWRC